MTQLLVTKAGCFLRTAMPGRVVECRNAWSGKHVFGHDHAEAKFVEEPLDGSGHHSLRWGIFLGAKRSPVATSIRVDACVCNGQPRVSFCAASFLFYCALLAERQSNGRSSALFALIGVWL